MCASNGKRTIYSVSVAVAMVLVVGCGISTPEESLSLEGKAENANPKVTMALQDMESFAAELSNELMARAPQGDDLTVDQLNNAARLKKIADLVKSATSQVLKRQDWDATTVENRATDSGSVLRLQLTNNADEDNLVAVSASKQGPGDIWIFGVKAEEWVETEDEFLLIIDDELKIAIIGDEVQIKFKSLQEQSWTIPEARLATFHGWAGEVKDLEPLPLVSEFFQPAQDFVSSFAAAMQDGASTLSSPDKESLITDSEQLNRMAALVLDPESKITSTPDNPYFVHTPYMNDGLLSQIAFNLKGATHDGFVMMIKVGEAMRVSLVSTDLSPSQVPLDCTDLAPDGDKLTCGETFEVGGHPANYERLYSWVTRIPL